MLHKALEVIEERVRIECLVSLPKKGLQDLVSGMSVSQTSQKKPQTELKTARIAIEGIFLKCASGSLVFVSPAYLKDCDDNLASIFSRKIVHVDNPILAVRPNVDLMGLEYRGKQDGVHLFREPAAIRKYALIPDSSYERFNPYVVPLKKAGFKIRRVLVG